MTRLRGLLAEGALGLFGIDPRHWTGPAFVGDTTRQAGRLTGATLVYLTEADARGFGVGNLARGAGDVDDMLVRFVSRFKVGYVAKRVRRRKRAFPPESMETTRIDAAVLGQERAFDLLVHKDLPLNVVAVTLEHGARATDVWLMGWAHDLGDLLPLLRPVDAAFAAAFDDTASPVPDPWEEQR